MKIFLTAVGIGVVSGYATLNLPQLTILTGAVAAVFFIAQLLDGLEVLDLGDYLDFYR